MRQYSYEWLLSFLRDEQARMLWPRSEVRHYPEQQWAVALTLDGAPVLWLDNTNRVLVDTGGVRTAMMKARLNHWLSPWRVKLYMDAGVWYVRGRDQDYLFADGLTIDGPSGQVLSTEQVVRSRFLHRHAPRKGRKPPPEVPP